MTSKNGYTASDLRLGQLITDLRKKRGLTLMQLGKKTNDLYQQIEKYEKGKRIPVAKLEQLAEALDIFIPKRIIRRIVSFRKKGFDEFESQLIELYEDAVREENGHSI